VVLTQAAAIVAAASIHVRHHHAPAYILLKSYLYKGHPCSCTPQWALTGHLTQLLMLYCHLSVCPSICLLRCILHPCCVSTETPHLKSATLHGHPFFLPLILHFNSLFCVSRCLLCLISARQDVFFWTNLHIHLTFLPSISSIISWSCRFTFQGGFCV